MASKIGKIYRRVTGTTDPILGGTTAVIGCMPVADIITGCTVTTNAVRTDTLDITGTVAIANLSMIGIGQYVYAGNVVREIIDYSEIAKKIYLEAPFPSPLSAVQLYTVRGKFQNVSISNSGAATAVVQEAGVKTTLVVNYEGNPVRPISYNATGTELTFELSK